MSDGATPGPTDGGEEPQTRQVTVYEYVGGDAFFAELVERFYAGVDHDPVIRPLYPDDLTDAKAHLVGFLVQFWGGPQTYSEQRGHPRLRMRHFPYSIGDAEAEAWFRHMAAAVESMALDDVAGPVLLEYFERAANAMINVQQ